MIVTIDGPVASGKSSVAHLLTKNLQFCYLNTGLFYRGAAYLLMKSGSKFETITDENIKTLTIEDIDCLKGLSFIYDSTCLHVVYYAKDITDVLVNSIYDQPASIVSAHPLVRENLLSLQREVAKIYNVIADGRDCGTVVFPDAKVKFFLTATIDVRANRLLHDAKRKIYGTSISDVRESLIQRDERDRNRSISPLRVPEDAIIVDNSSMTLEQTLSLMLEIVESKIPRPVIDDQQDL